MEGNKRQETGKKPCSWGSEVKRGRDVQRPLVPASYVHQQSVKAEESLTFLMPPSQLMEERSCHLLRRHSRPGLLVHHVTPSSPQSCERSVSVPILEIGKLRLEMWTNLC